MSPTEAMESSPDAQTPWKAVVGMSGGRASDDERRCRATSKQSGERCRKWAIPGGRVCVMHGGKAAQVRQRAAERVVAKRVRAEAEAVLAHEGMVRVEDPLETLGLIASEALAMKDAIAARVNSLGEIRYEGQGAEQLRAEVALYERAIDRSVRILDVLAKHNWAERRIELEEARAQLVIGAFLEVIRVLGLVGADRELAVRTFLAGLGQPEEMSALPSGRSA